MAEQRSTIVHPMGGHWPFGPFLLFRCCGARDRAKCITARDEEEAMLISLWSSHYRSIWGMLSAAAGICVQVLFDSLGFE